MKGTIGYDVQRFGSNDTTTTTTTLTLEYDIDNGDAVQKMQLKNPKSGISAAGIRATMEADLSAQIFLNKNDTEVVLGSDTATVGSAYETIKTTRELDLS